jgi:hypothetical protein
MTRCWILAYALFEERINLGTATRSGKPRILGSRSRLFRGVPFGIKPRDGIV